MKTRILGGVLLGMLLWAGLGLTQAEAGPPPAEDEVAVLEDAFDQVASFFREFILDIRGSLTMLDARVKELERTSLALQMEQKGFRAVILDIRGSLTMLDARIEELAKASLVFQMGLKELAERIIVQEGHLAGLAGRLTTVERAIDGAIGPKIVELDRRISALEKHDFVSLEGRLAALDVAHKALSLRVEHNRAKIEAVEMVLVGLDAALTERLAGALLEVEVEMANQRQEIETLRAELTRVAQGQQAQWTAIFLVPLAVGGLLFLLLTAGS